MKLFYSKPSPFSRKVRAAAVAMGLENQIQLVEVPAAAESAELKAVNPLGKIPALVTDDGFGLFDSPVICEYLNGISEQIPIIPEAGAPRWIALRQQAIGDRLSEAAVLCRQLESAAKVGNDNVLFVRQKDTINRVLGMLDGEKLAHHVDVGTLAIACALGYLDLRYSADGWRAKHPKLADWFDEMSERPCLATTKP
jgi:glutathione S-transferase